MPLQSSIYPLLSNLGRSMSKGCVSDIHGDRIALYQDKVTRYSNCILVFCQIKSGNRQNLFIIQMSLSDRLLLKNSYMKQKIGTEHLDRQKMSKGTNSSKLYLMNNKNTKNFNIFRVRLRDRHFHRKFAQPASKVEWPTKYRENLRSFRTRLRDRHVHWKLAFRAI